MVFLGHCPGGSFDMTGVNALTYKTESNSFLCGCSVLLHAPPPPSTTPTSRPQNVRPLSKMNLSTSDSLFILSTLTAFLHDTQTLLKHHCRNLQGKIYLDSRKSNPWSPALKVGMLTTRLARCPNILSAVGRKPIQNLPTEKNSGKKTCNLANSLFFL